MSKKSLKKYCLALLVSLFLTACGTGGSSSGNNGIPEGMSGEMSNENNAGLDSSGTETKTAAAVQTPEWIYVPEIITLGAEDVDYDDMCLAGDTFCYISRGGDVENAVRNICQYSISDRKLTTFSIGWQSEAGTRDLGYYTFARDRSLYTTANVYSSDYGQMNRFLCKFDPEGKQILYQDISEQVDRNMSVSGIAVDAREQIYIFTYDSGIWLYGADGKFHGSIAHDSSERMVLKGTATGHDGNLYVCFGKGNDPDYCALAKVDFDAGQLQEIDNTLSGIIGFAPGAQEGDPAHQYDFLLYDDSCVYTYDIATRERGELFSWLDSDVNGNFVESFGMLEDGRIYAAYEDWSINDYGITLLTRTNSEQVTPKEYLTLAAVNPENNLTAMAVHFNKNNFQYHVTVQSYDSMNDLYNAILAGEPVDLISLSNVNVQKMCDQDIFEDLTPYVDQSSAFGRDDFLDGILDTYTFDDTLVSIPATFTLQTVVGDRELVGDKTGMTLEEFFAAVDLRPGSQAFDEITKEELTQYLMLFNEETFIDWDTGECRFDSAEFKKLLELVKQCPDVIEEPGEKEESMPTKILNGKVLFAIADVYLVSDLQLYGDIFRGNDISIGFPSTEGKDGNLLITGDAVAIAAKSGHKEGAWAFIEKELIRGNESCYPDVSLLPTGFPTLKEVFQSVMEDKIEQHNQRPSDRFPMKIYNDGYTFRYHAVDWDEINAMLELLQNTRPASSSDSDDIVKIIHEEAQAYYSGQKSADDVADIIQNRVSLYVGENM